MDRKIVFFDIDGTLIEYQLGQTDMLDSTKNSIRELQGNGHLALIATGRCPAMIPRVVNDFGFSGKVTCNGAYVELDGEDIYKEVISVDVLRRIKEFCSNRKMVYFFESKDSVYVQDITEQVIIDFINTWGMDEKVVKNMVEDYSSVEIHLAMVGFLDKHDWDDMEKEFASDFDFQMHSAPVSGDLTIKGCSKAKGIYEFVKRINGDMKDTYAFGDGNNDLEMIEAVEYGIAMGNAVDSLKAIAKYHTDRTENHGIAKGLIKFNLIRGNNTNF